MNQLTPSSQHMADVVQSLETIPVSLLINTWSTELHFRPVFLNTNYSSIFHCYLIAPGNCRRKRIESISPSVCHSYRWRLCSGWRHNCFAVTQCQHEHALHTQPVASCCQQPHGFAAHAQKVHVCAHDRGGSGRACTCTGLQPEQKALYVCAATALSGR